MEKNTQHPVAWVWQFEDGEFYETPHHTKDECERDCCGYDGMAVPLYTAPPVPRDVLLAFGKEVADEIARCLPFPGRADIAALADSYASKAQSEPVPSGQAMHMPSGFVFDEVLAAAEPSDLVALTPQLEPVNHQMLAALKHCHAVFDQYIEHHLKKPDYAKAASSEHHRKVCAVAIAAAEQAQESEQVNQRQAGVYHKFNVSRTDGRDQLGGDRHGAEYFVLDVTHDEFAMPALAAYAAACRSDYPALADDMVRRYGIAQQQAEPVALSLPFFAYDSEVGFERFDTEAKARQFVQDGIDECRSNLLQGEAWPSEIENLCWGVVLGTTKEIKLCETEDSSGDYYSEYELTAAQPPAVADGYALVPIEPTDDMCAAAWDSEGTDYVGEHHRIVRFDIAYKAAIAVAQKGGA